MFQKMILNLLTFFGALALFIYGMGLLSSGIQKACGDKLRSFLPWMTGHRYQQVLAGTGITVLIQSSQATTLLAVSFVNAGLLSLCQAVNVMMGANIGTTLTSWIVASAGFLKVDFYPIIAVGVGFVLSMGKNPVAKNIGTYIIGIAIVLISTSYMYRSLPLTGDGLPAFFARTSTGSVGHVLLYLIGGMLLAGFTKSSPTIAVSMILLTLGWIDFPAAAAIVLGANVGTTFPGNFAARKADAQAKRAAMAHTVFNVIGAAPVLIAWKPATSGVEALSKVMGLTAPAFSVAVFHTMFNLASTLILIWFNKYIVRFVTWFSKDTDPAGEASSASRLKYLGDGRLGTPALLIEQANKEILSFSIAVRSGFQHVFPALRAMDDAAFGKARDALVKCEEDTDRYEYDIADFLRSLSGEQMTGHETEEIRIIYRVIGELESLGDSCENISRLLYRVRVHGQKFDEGDLAKIERMTRLVEDALDIMDYNLNQFAVGGLTDISNACAAEDAINRERDTLRTEAIQQIEGRKGNYLAMNYFLDLIAEYEAMGDFIINVSQAIVRTERQSPVGR